MSNEYTSKIDVWNGSYRQEHVQEQLCGHGLDKHRSRQAIERLFRSGIEESVWRQIKFVLDGQYEREV